MKAFLPQCELLKYRAPIERTCIPSRHTNRFSSLIVFCFTNFLIKISVHSAILYPAAEIEFAVTLKNEKLKQEIALTEKEGNCIFVSAPGQVRHFIELSKA